MLPVVYLIVLLLAFLSGLTTLIGVALALKFGNNIKGIVIGLGFSAGIMLLISVLELIPESVAAAGVLNSSVAVFLGVLLFGTLNFVLPHTHLVKEKG